MRIFRQKAIPLAQAVWKVRSNNLSIVSMARACIGLAPALKTSSASGPPSSMVPLTRAGHGLLDSPNKVKYTPSLEPHYCLDNTRPWLNPLVKVLYHLFGRDSMSDPG
jgi:hypothetical protein